ncbi:7525_t:CDS:2, partial [Cetraspora pellucida]
DESNYTLNELEFNEYIFIENLLKEINVYLDSKDGNMLLLFLDPDDKLEDVRKIFTETNTNGFKFRWKNGTIVNEYQENVRRLKEILVNGNELYISTPQKSKVIIYSGQSKTPSRYSLDKGKSLAEIREELENTWKEQSQLYMCSNCYFLDQDKHEIVGTRENKLNLGDILSIENGNDVLNICRKHEHDLIKLTNKCGYGFIMKDGSVKRAKYRAFIIEETPEHHYFEDKYEEDLFECKNEFQELYKRNFITFVLKKIAEDYGYFYASSVCFGGVIIQKMEDTKYSKHQGSVKTFNIESQLVGTALETGQSTAMKLNSIKSRCVIRGGAEYCNRSSWIHSIQDPETWEIIEYNEIHSIFSLLENSLRKTVLEILGKRILKVNIDKFEYSMDKNKQHSHEIGEQLEAYDTHENPIIIINRVPNKKKLAKKSNVKIFRPKCIPVRIGWMVIGYPTDTFDFELSNQTIIESEKLELNDQYIVNNFSHQTNLNLEKCALSTCVIDNVENSLQEETSSTSEISSTNNSNNTSQSNVRDFKLVVGSHFSLRLNSACLFAYCSKIRKRKPKADDEPLLQSLKLFICTIYTKQLISIKCFDDKVKWKNKNILSKSRSLYLAANEINTNDKPIFVNHSFDKDCHNDECHGIINVSPGHLHFKILNDYSFVNNNPKISYFCVSPEEILYKNDV